MTAIVTDKEIRVKLRPAVAGDAEQLQVMCDDLLASQEVGVPSNLNSMRSTFASLLNNPNCGVWVAVYDETVLGVISGIITPPLWNAQERVAKLLFWYVKPRLFNELAPHLLRVFETWASEQQAACIMATTLAGRSSDHMLTFFQSHEYETVEYLMAKKLSPPSKTQNSGPLEN